MYSIGIEEEYFVFDAKTRRAVTRANGKFVGAAKKRLGDRLMPEMLQSQIEVATPPCETMDEARGHLTGFRATLAEEAAKQNVGIAAMGTFPLAHWTEQTVTPGKRYATIADDLGVVGLRNMMCGLHVHVSVPEPAYRVDLMKRITPYLPLMLALSTSSPFWEGRATGLHGYRLAAYDELPRTGLPEFFQSQKDFDEYVEALVWAKIIPDASYIWWVIRPSLRYPTLELRIADACTRVEDTLAIAALYRCLIRALDKDRNLNCGFDLIGRAITQENKWHAQRYGVHAVFVDPFRKQPVTAQKWLDEVMDFIAPDAAALGCQAELARCGDILRHGSSADEQMKVYDAARKAGRTRPNALKDVVDWAAAETIAPAKPGRQAA